MCSNLIKFNLKRKLFYLLNLFNNITKCLNTKGFKVSVIVMIFTLLSLPGMILAFTPESKGEDLFKQHCSGCHVNGGNVIRRQKSLKIKALKRWGLDSPEQIAKIARE